MRDHNSHVLKKLYFKKKTIALNSSASIQESNVMVVMKLGLPTNKDSFYDIRCDYNSYV